MNRPKTYTVAAIIQFLISIIAVIFAVPQLIQGADVVIASGFPFVVVLFMFGIGLLGLLSAYGIWRNQKWGVILTIVLRLVDGLLALPGVPAAPTAQLQIFAALSVLAAVVVIGLLLWQKPKPTADSHAAVQR